jgi:hypothetical protein
MGLKPGTTYHYRVIAATSVLTEDTTEWEGPTVEGPDQAFTTPPAGAAPVIDPVSISHPTPAEATLEAQIGPGQPVGSNGGDQPAGPGGSSSSSASGVKSLVR